MKLENEDLILASACKGDPGSIGLLINHYQPDLKKFAHGVCQSSEDAEDAVQHTLLVMSTKMSLFRQAAKLSSWLFTIIKNECLKFSKKRNSHVEADEYLVDPTIDAESALSERQTLAQIQTAFSRLEPMYREVFIFRDVEGLSAHEVSRRLGISISAVKSRLHRARNEVRLSFSA